MSLDAAVRTLLLPLKPGTGGEYALRADQILNDLGVVEDHADWVHLEATAWEQTGSPTTKFKRFVAALLFSPGLKPETYVLDPSSLPTAAEASNVLTAISSKYFDMHKRIKEDEKCDHQEASRILSHLHSILLLAIGGRMTASRIYSMLLADGIELGRSWTTVRTVLDRCGLAQVISVQDVQDLFKQEALGEAELLGDLDLSESIDFVAAVSARFGYTGDILTQLRTLFLTDLHPPYLCIMHFQLTAQALYNHKLVNAYEFEPRGERVLWLAKQYNQRGLSVSKSPFLNNAKSVDALDAAWASSKKPRERHAARALADLLNELDCLSDPSRSAASQYLRALLHRKLRLSLQKKVAMPNPIPVLDAASAKKLLEGVGLKNTGTRGVVEQRLADAIALHEAGDLNDWRPRGFGDSVFATNTSKKKFGDAELKHLNELKIIAIEAHGGRLTERYVQDHLATLKAVLPLRIEELEDRAPIKDWKLVLEFFAHDIEPAMTKSADVDGLRVDIVYRRFSELVGVPVNPPLILQLNQSLQVPLNAEHVHPLTRDAVLQLL